MTLQMGMPAVWEEATMWRSDGERWVRMGAELGQAGTWGPRLTRGFFCSFWGLSLLLVLLCYKIKVSRMI